MASGLREVLPHDPFRLPLIGPADIALEADIPGPRVRHREWLRVAHLDLPGLHQPGEALDFPGVPRVAGEVARLVRVALQVEELAVVDRRVDDELPALVAHRTHEVLEGQEDRVADLFPGPGPQPPEVLSGLFLLARDA